MIGVAEAGKEGQVVSVPIRRRPRLAGQCFGGVKGCALEEMERRRISPAKASGSSRAANRRLQTSVASV